MTTRFHSQCALITGSTSGIGEAIARRLAAEGAHVLISGRDQTRGDALVAELESSGQAATFIAADLTAPSAAIRAFAGAATEAAGGTPDILVLNAGLYPVTPTEALTDADLEAMLSVNIRAPHVLVGALAPAMAERGRGVIVVISSWMDRCGFPYGAMYTATKAADAQLARAWSAEYGARGVRVNALAPGVTFTPGNAAHRETLEAMTAPTPGGTVVLPEHIAAGVAFLASDDATMVHGHTLFVDGGISTTRAQ